MDLGLVASAIEAAFAEVGIATQEALRDDARIKSAARIALDLAPLGVRQIVLFTIGSDGFERLVLRLRDRLVTVGSAQRGPLTTDDIRRVLLEGLRSEALLASPADPMPAGQPVPPGRPAFAPQVKASPVPVKAPQRAAYPVILPTRVGQVAPAQPVHLAQRPPIQTPSTSSVQPVSGKPVPGQTASGQRVPGTKIDLQQLQAMLADDSVDDAAIAPYLRAVADERRPGVPLIGVAPDLVEGASDRGLLPSFGDMMGLGIKALNERSNRIRRKRFLERINSGWRGPRLLAEGDSWFQYPILLHDVVDELSLDHAIASLAQAGDTLENMVRGRADIEQAIVEYDIDVLLLSGGGNDIAGEPLASYLAPWSKAAERPEQLVRDETFGAFLSAAEHRLDTLFSELLARFPKLQVLMHGYDWPLPRQGGPWLAPALLARAIPLELQAAVLRLLIDRYYEMLARLAARHGERVHIVDCRGVVGAPADWFDELHPTTPGYRRVGALFRQTIARAFGSSKQDRGGQSTAFAVAWGLSATTGKDERVRRVLEAGARVSVGRAADRDIVLDDARVSRLHAQFEVTANGVVVEDMNSSNGTVLDGRPVGRAFWQPGNSLSIGPFVLTLEAVGPAASSLPAASGGVVPSPAPGPVLPALSSQGIVPGHAGSKTLMTRAMSANIAGFQGLPVVVALFENVSPLASAGAAHAVDVAMDGRLSSLFQAGRLELGAGAITVLPTAESGTLQAPVLVAGLGPFATFSEQRIEAVARSLALAAHDARLTEFATVPIGCNVGLDIRQVGAAFLRGLASGLAEQGEGEGIRRVTFCDLDADRIATLTHYLSEQAGAGANPAGLLIEVDAAGISAMSEVPKTTPPPALRAIYVLVTQPDEGTFNVTLLGASPGAAIPSYSLKMTADAARVLDQVLAAAAMLDPELGRELARAVLPGPALGTLCQSMKQPGSSFVFVHDRNSASIPWEAMYFDDDSPALRPGISRLYAIEQRSRSVAGPLRRNRNEAIRLLLVDNPTGDLAGAARESQAIAEIFKAGNGALHVLSAGDAHRAAVMEALDSGDFDILHYAGHADFDPASPSASCLKLADGPMTAADLCQLQRVPQLIFLNACESGRIRGEEPVTVHSARNFEFLAKVSLAEALLASGVQSFIGTYWPVNDLAACAFSQVFYEALVAGKPVAVAMSEARQKLVSMNSRDWANYLHFGDPTAILRQA